MNFSKFCLGFLLLFSASFAFSCPSKVTLSINSSNYSGIINIELRTGNRPGSRVVNKGNIDTKGKLQFNGVCAGNYFFALSSPSDDQVSLTQYFDVINNGKSYSNPTITVLYTRISSEGHKLGSAKKSEL